MMEVILYKKDEINKVGHEGTSKEWMAIIMGLSKGATATMFESVKRYLENVWRMRERKRMIRVGS
jgi:hypothetical protein